MSKKTGKLSCMLCGSNLIVSSRSYGGMQRFVCVVQTCANSEIAWDMES